MKSTEKFLFVFGVFIAVMGLPFLMVGLFGGFYKPPKQGMSQAIGLTVLMGVIPVAGGLILCYDFAYSNPRNPAVNV